MTDAPYRWGLIPTRFSTFAAAVDGQGRVVRFWLHTDRKPRGIEDDGAVAEVRRQVEAYQVTEPQTLYGAEAFAQQAKIDVMPPPSPEQPKVQNDPSKAAAAQGPARATPPSPAP